VRENGWLFILDFCWFANVLFTALLLLLAGDAIPMEHRRTCYTVFYAVGTGPLAWSVIVLSNGLIFHSVEKMTSVFIHFLPCVVCLTIRNHPEALEEAWPGRFPEHDIGALEAAYSGMAAYLVWLILYASWLLSCGVDAPDRGLPTVFNNIYVRAGLAEKLTRCTGGFCTSRRSHAALYLCVHVAGVLLSFTWPMACVSLTVHEIFVPLLLLKTIWTGAGHYNFVIAERNLLALSVMLNEKDDIEMLGGSLPARRSSWS